MSTETITAAINPLTGELTTITVVHRRDKVDVQGRVVAPGLALTPSPKENDKHPERYALTHIATGLAVIPGVCGKHALYGVERTLTIAVDWTISDKNTVIEAAKAAGFLDVLTDVRFSCNSRWCTDGDGPEPPCWGVRCETCGWEWDEYEYDHLAEWPLSAEEAKRLADDHECEPTIQVWSPETGEWGTR